MKNLFLLIALLVLSTSTFSQIPGYLPTNGLLGYWPFNGNANDESGKGNNGTITAATLTVDRSAKQNKAYNLNTSSAKIALFTGFTNLTTNRTISFWFKTSPTTQEQKILSYRPSCKGGSETFFEFYIEPNKNTLVYLHSGSGSAGGNYIANSWNSVILTINNNLASLYLNDTLVGSVSNVTAMTQSGIFGVSAVNTCISAYGQNKWFTGDIDEIGVWNRALARNEIKILHHGCDKLFATQPNNQLLNTGTTGNFSVTSKDSGIGYRWQTNAVNLGWQDIPSNLSYLGVNTSTLTKKNIQLGNHLQPFRVIGTLGNCTDTSNIAILSVADTCIVIINDTNYISVTDTLIIKAKLTGITPPNNINTVKVFPNPTKDYITIDFGNFSSMNGYTVKIINTLGQTVFNSSINQQSSYINLSSLGGKGIYFIHIIDKKGNSIEIRKLLLQ